MLKIVALTYLLIGLALCGSIITINNCTPCSNGTCLTLDGGGFSQYSGLTSASCSTFGNSFPNYVDFICVSSC